MLVLDTVSIESRRFSCPESPDDVIAALARGQYGAFTREQALAQAGATASMIQRRLASGKWIKIHNDVFSFPSSPATWHRSLIAAVFAAGTTAAASHRSGAEIWRLSGYEPGIVEISMTRDRRRSLNGVIVHRVRDLPPCDVTVHDGIPVTSVARTLIDLASVWPEDKVGEALDDGNRRKIVSVPWLRWRVANMTRSGRNGLKVVNKLLDERPTAFDSELEKKLLHAMRGYGLPEPIPQFEVRDGDGRFVARVDFAYPDVMLAVEADGYEWHHGRKRWRRDLARRNDLTALGWRVIHVTAEDLDQKLGATMQRIAGALGG